MKRTLIVLVFVIVIQMVFANLLEYLPAEFNSLIYIPDLQKAYDAFKNTEIGEALMDSLGFESMADNLIRSQFDLYNIDTDEFYAKVKELMIITWKDGAALAMGPIVNHKGIRDFFNDLGVFEETITYLGKEYHPVLKDLGDYMVLYVGEQENLESLKRSQNNIPKWVKEALKDPKVLGISFMSKENVLETHSKVYSDGKKLILKGEAIIEDDELLKDVRGLTPKGSFPKSMVKKGEGFLMVNVSSGKALMDLLETLGLQSVLASDRWDDLENIMEPFSGKMFASLEYSQALLNLTYGESATPSVYVEIGFSKIPQKLLENLKEKCQKLGGETYECEEGKVVLKGNTVVFEYPEDMVLSVDVNEKKFGEFYTGNESLMVFLDFSNFLNNMFGLQVDSHALLKVWLEGNKIKVQGELR